MMSGAAEGATTAIITAAIAGALVGVTTIALSVSHHKEAVRLARIRVINDLHEKYLKPANFPPIFEMKKDDKNGEVAVSITMGKKVFEDIAQATPAFSDSDLILYGDLILEAMAGIQKFYQYRLDRTLGTGRGNAEDDTSSVMCYVLLMLSAHCIKFADYDVTLKQILALHDFVLAFASIGNDKKRDRYKFLRPVAVTLKKAHDHLKDHFLSMNMAEKLDLLIHNLADINKKLLRCMTKLIVNKKYWKNVDWLMPHQLSEGILEYNYETGAWFGSKDKVMDHSMFAQLIIECSHHYEHAIRRNDDGSFIKKDNLPIIPLDTEKDIRKAREGFAKSTNFLTYKINQPGWTPEMVRQAVGFFKDEVIFIIMLNAGLYYLTEMEREYDTFGNIYFTQAHHCEFIFTMLKLFSALVQKSSGALYEKMDKINTANEDQLLEEEQAVYKEMYGLFTRITTGKIANAQAGEVTQMSIADYFKFLTDCHNARLQVRQIDKKKFKGEVIVSSDALLTLTFLMSEVFDLDTGFLPIFNTTNSTHLVDAAVKEAKKNRLHRRGSEIRFVGAEADEKESPINLLKDHKDHKGDKGDAVLAVTHTIPGVVATPASVPVHKAGLTLTLPVDNPLAATSFPPTIPVAPGQVITVMQANPPPAAPVVIEHKGQPLANAEPPPPITTLLVLNSIENKNKELAAAHNGEHIKLYDQMYCELLKVFLYLKFMDLENSSSRHEKAADSLELLHDICLKTLAFLNSDRSVAEAGKFSALVRHEMSAPAQGFLDRHKTVSAKRIMCMSTRTRDLMTDYANLCDELVSHGMRRVI
jgi:hypothetical protein